jgi:hypothetical protein
LRRVYTGINGCLAECRLCAPKTVDWGSRWRHLEFLAAQRSRAWTLMHMVCLDAEKC